MEVFQKAPAQLLVNLDVMIGLSKGFTVQFFEVLFQLLERTFLEDGIAVEVDDCKEGSLYDLKIASILELLPDEHEIAEVEYADEDTKKRLAACQLNNHLHVRHLLLAVGLSLL